jgi:hypothetical protein
MVGFSAFFASEQETNAVIGGDDDLVQMALMGIAFAQIAVVVFGASLITAEFASGMIRTTLTATQGRLRVLLAKAVVLSVVLFPIALAASAVGFVAGAYGALLLILRRRAADRVTLISLIGMIVWLAGMLLTPRFRDLLSTEQIAALLIIVALTWTIFWFARHSRQRGWLR